METTLINLLQLNFIKMRPENADIRIMSTWLLIGKNLNEYLTLPGIC